MDILEVLNYLSEKYNFDEEDLAIVDEITNQIVNSEYNENDDQEDYDYEDEDEYDIAEER